MAYNDLREFLADHEDELLRVKQPFDPRFEIAALLQELQPRGQPVLLETIEGYPGARVVGNLFSSRKRLASALGTTEEKLAQTYMSLKEQRLAPVIYEDPAPVKEVVRREPQDLLSILPILTHHAKDVAPFITSGVVFAKDPETGRRSMGIHRMMVRGGKQLGIFLANPPLSSFLSLAEAKGRPLEVAVALGVDPATLLAAAVKFGPAGPDKLEVAGALRGLPMELVRAESVDLEVPARAEIVIEGHILPGVREQEGPFGESSGYYFSNMSPVMEVCAVTHRHDFIYTSMNPCSMDVDNLLSLAAGTGLLGQLQSESQRDTGLQVMDLEAVAGTCGFTAVIAVRESRPAEVQQLIRLALGMDKRLKIVTVVDEDVNIRDPREVAWAMATRFQPDRDTVLLKGEAAYVIDPFASTGDPGSKVGYDATRGPGSEYDRAVIPKAAVAKARSTVAEMLTASNTPLQRYR